MRVSLFTITTTRERENERDGALMRKYPERENECVSPFSVSEEKKKRKKKLGHWMFRVFCPWLWRA